MEGTSKQSSSRSKSYITGLISGYVVVLATMLVNLWLTPYSLNFLSKAEFGVFALCGDVLVWFGFMDLGLLGSLRVQASRLSKQSQHDQLSGLASTAFYCQLAIAILLLIVGLIAAPLFSHVFRLPVELRADAIWVFWILLAGTAITLATQTYSALLFALQRIHVDNVIKISVLAVRTVITVLLLRSGFGLRSLAIAILVGTVVAACLALWRCRVGFPKIRIATSLVSREALKSLSRLGVWFTLGNIAGIVILTMDRAVTARVISLEAVTLLTLTGRLYSLASSALDDITSTARPGLGQLLGESNSSAALLVYRRLVVMSTGGAILLGSAVWAGNRTFVTSWVGPWAYGGSWLDMALATNFVIHAWVLPNRALLTAATVVREPTVARALEGAANLFLSVVFAFQFGIYGVALGTAVASLLTSSWYLPWLTARFFKQPFLAFVIQDSWRLIACGVPIIGLATYLRTVFQHTHELHFAAISMALVLCSGSLLLWLFAFDDGMKRQFTGVLSTMRLKFMQSAGRP
jgi:O-antigen/teichoic acid export membrane protein